MKNSRNNYIRYSFYQIKSCPTNKRLTAGTRTFIEMIYFVIFRGEVLELYYEKKNCLLLNIIRTDPLRIYEEGYNREMFEFFNYQRRFYTIRVTIDHNTTI